MDLTDTETANLMSLLKRNQTTWTMSVVNKLIQHSNDNHHWPLESKDDTFVGPQDVYEQIGVAASEQ